MNCKDISDTTRSLSYLSVLSPLLYWNPQWCSWNYISYLISMGYSCLDSSINLIIHITKSVLHFVYTVGLDYSGNLISHLYTWAPFLKPQICLHNTFTLSHFRGLFNDYIRPTIFISYLRINPKVSSSTSWTDKYY